MKTTILDEYLKDEEFRRLFSQEDLIMEVTETLCELLEKEEVSRKELADRLGKSKGFVSQLLNGGRNLTLRTVADILHVLGYKVSLKPQKLRQESNVIESQYRFKMPESQYRMLPRPEEKWGALKSSFPDNYPDIQMAISG